MNTLIYEQGLTIFDFRSQEICFQAPFALNN
jgi:hypothetical protein